MLRGRSLAPSLTRISPLLAFSKIPLLIQQRSYCTCLSFLHYSTYFVAKSLNDIKFPRLSMDRTHLCTLAASSTSPINESSEPEVFRTGSNRAKKKARKESPDAVLKHKLDMCSKNGDLLEALSLYEDARSKGLQLNLHHYNVLLYLCSSSNSSSFSSSVSTGLGIDEADIGITKLGFKRGFEIFQQMAIDKVSPNEATFTSAARLAVAMENADMAFNLVKQMKSHGIPPKLRSYGPALLGFCNKGEADKAYEVDADMIESGVLAEEPELSALLKVSVDAKKEEKVYEMLHRLRVTVRQVSESTVDIIKDWFVSEAAAEVGEDDWDIAKVREGILKGGGGWHGHGWLGRGKWRVMRTQMDDSGLCHTCGEKLVCIDIDPRETDEFASSLSSLACKREAKADFIKFQEWLEQHGPFDAVVDGANIGLTNQHVFSFSQLNFVVNQLRRVSPSKRLPLIILHRSRVTGGPAKNPNNSKLLESWKKAGALYATPAGSNDDWYWLFAAVCNKCLLVTNDEMRDHLFQLLGTSFFPRWKEKHQVRLSVSRRGINLHMPPPYSIVIQESNHGSWHVPTVTGDDIEVPRQWLCVTRGRDGREVNN